MLAPNTSLSGQLRFRLFSVHAILMGTLYHLWGELSRVGCTVSAPSGRDHPTPMSQVPACQPGGGRSAGVHFDWPKWTKSHLGRSPLRTSPGVQGWNCVKVLVRPVCLAVFLLVPPHQAILGSWPYGVAVFPSGPTLEKRLFPAVGSQAPGSRERLQHSKLRPWQ